MDWLWMTWPTRTAITEYSDDVMDIRRRNITNLHMKFPAYQYWVECQIPSTSDDQKLCKIWEIPRLIRSMDVILGIKVEMVLLIVLSSSDCWSIIITFRVSPAIKVTKNRHILTISCVGLELYISRVSSTTHSADEALTLSRKLSDEFKSMLFPRSTL